MINSNQEMWFYLQEWNYALKNYPFLRKYKPLDEHTDDKNFEKLRCQIVEVVGRVNIPYLDILETNPPLIRPDMKTALIIEMLHFQLHLKQLKIEEVASNYPNDKVLQENVKNLKRPLQNKEYWENILNIIKS